MCPMADRGRTSHEAAHRRATEGGREVLRTRAETACIRASHDLQEDPLLDTMSDHDRQLADVLVLLIALVH